MYGENVWYFTLEDAYEVSFHNAQRDRIIKIFYEWWKVPLHMKWALFRIALNPEKCQNDYLASKSWLMC